MRKKLEDFYRKNIKIFKPSFTMRSFILPITIFIGLALVINSCGFGMKSKAAEPYADEFYSHLKNHDYDAIVEMVDEEALKISPESDWRAVLEQKESLGELRSVKKKTGFHSEYKNGYTYVTLNYTLKYDDYKLHEKLLFIQRGGKFKIFSYEYNEDETKLTSD